MKAEIAVLPGDGLRTADIAKPGEVAVSTSAMVDAIEKRL